MATRTGRDPRTNPTGRGSWRVRPRASSKSATTEAPTRSPRSLPFWPHSRPRPTLSSTRPGPRRRGSTRRPNGGSTRSRPPFPTASPSPSLVPLTATRKPTGPRSTAFETKPPRRSRTSRPEQRPGPRCWFRRPWRRSGHRCRPAPAWSDRHDRRLGRGDDPWPRAGPAPGRTRRSPGDGLEQLARPHARHCSPRSTVRTFPPTHLAGPQTVRPSRRRPGSCGCSPDGFHRVKACSPGSSPHPSRSPISKDGSPSSLVWESDPAIRLGSLAVAWPRVASANSPNRSAASLATSVWGDPGGTDRTTIALSLRRGLDPSTRQPGTGGGTWSKGSAAVLVAREQFASTAPSVSQTGRVVDGLLGRHWRDASSSRLARRSATQVSLLAAGGCERCGRSLARRDRGRQTGQRRRPSPAGPVQAATTKLPSRRDGAAAGRSLAGSRSHRGCGPSPGSRGVLRCRGLTNWYRWPWPGLRWSRLTVGSDR